MTAGRLADVWPLTPAQEGLFFQAQLDSDGPDVYLVQCRFRVDGAVDADRLRTAVTALLTRHPNLRVCFRHNGLDRPVQVVPHRVTVPWAEVDLAGCPAAEAAARLEAVLEADRARRFDVTRPPLVRCTLVRDPGGADLILTLHHLLLDGWSMAIVVRELAALYAGRAAGLPPAPPFRDYLSWLQEQDGAAAAGAWRAALAGLAQPPRVAGDAPPRGAVLPGSIERELPAGLTAAVHRRARHTGVTVNTLVQAAWGLVLARMTGAADVVFGAVVSGRPPELPGVDTMVGLLVNTVPVRVRLRPGERVDQLLVRLRDEQLLLLPHHSTRLTEIRRQAGTGDLFDTLVAFENFPRGTGAPDGNGLRLVSTRDASHLPLALTIVPGPRMWLRLQHRPDCFAPAEAELVVERFTHALELLAADPGAEAHRLEVLPEPERRLVLRTWNGAARAVPPGSVLDRFRGQVHRTPDAPAVQAGDRILS
ncbi:condensation domain-containing protein, partial [Actinoplanes sp. NPDC026623]|uniref:condensation domain-containing protein n=1 Tax=Actinoplanes sp. NPDC026623 TaxID=3155610 RepID=UPI0033DFFD72